MTDDVTPRAEGVRFVSFHADDVLGARLLKQAFALRTEVFVIEQRVPVDLEIDVHDQTCLHLLALTDEASEHGESAVAAARLLPPSPEGGKAHLGRLAVRRDRRGTGLGAAMVRAVEEQARAAGYTALELDAQVSAIGFYERLGYTAFGPVFDDAGIDHRTMSRTLGDAPE